MTYAAQNIKYGMIPELLQLVIPPPARSQVNMFSSDLRLYLAEIHSFRD